MEYYSEFKKKEIIQQATHGWTFVEHYVENIMENIM